MTSSPLDLACRLGGPQGSGIDTLALVLMHACAAAGYEVLGRREYHSNIMGRHSYCDVRVSPQPPTSHRDSLDLLLAAEPETLCRHAAALRPGGLLIHCTEDSALPLDRLQFLDPRLRAELGAGLAAEGLDAVVSSVTTRARRRGVVVVSLPLLDLLGDVVGKGRRTGEERLVNMLALATACALLGLPAECLLAAVERVLGDRPPVAALNRTAVETAYRHAAAGATVAAPARLEPRQLPGERLLVNGSQGAALGKLAGGLGFQAYYPITPATDESAFLEAHAAAAYADSPVGGPLILQVEDELAALAMACGAALTGARSATATSGPGFSLMAETLGWAGMNEIPVVITLFQRGGPSTGMPSRTEQGDLQFALYGGHGEFPRLVLASGDVGECFCDAALALDYAARYQTPVIHLLDKALASTTVSLPPFAARGLRIDHGERARDMPLLRFADNGSGVSPRLLLGRPGEAHWLTGCEHGPEGRVSEDPGNREAMMAKRARKLKQAVLDLPRQEKLEVYADPHARFTLLTWGSTKGAGLEAIERLRAAGTPARVIQVRLLWPFPASELLDLLDNAAPLVVAECNHSGQLATLLSARTGRTCDHLVVKFNGRPFSGEALYRALAAIAAGRGRPRMEIHHNWE